MSRSQIMLIPCSEHPRSPSGTNVDPSSDVGHTRISRAVPPGAHRATGRSRGDMTRRQTATLPTHSVRTCDTKQHHVSRATPYLQNAARGPEIDPNAPPRRLGAELLNPRAHAPRRPGRAHVPISRTLMSRTAAGDAVFFAAGMRRQRDNTCTLRNKATTPTASSTHTSRGPTRTATPHPTRTPRRKSRAQQRRTL